jgi:hypothetical protein
MGGERTDKETLRQALDLEGAREALEEENQDILEEPAHPTARRDNQQLTC